MTEVSPIFWFSQVILYPSSILGLSVPVTEHECQRIVRSLLHSKFKFGALSLYIETRWGVYETLYRNNSGIALHKTTELEKGEHIIYPDQTIIPSLVDCVSLRCSLD